MSGHWRLLSLLALLAFPLAAGAASKRFDVQQQGTLRDVIRAIAEKAEMSVIVVGPVEGPAEVYLHQVTGEEALQTLAKLHGLKVEQEGKTFVVRSPGAVPATVPAMSPAADESEAPASADASGDEDAAGIVIPPPPALPVGPNPNPLPPPPPHPRGRASDRVVAGKLHIREGETVDSAVSFGGPLIVDGHVLRDVVAMGGVVKLGPKAVVDGNIVSLGAKVERAPGAKVGRDEVVMGLEGLQVLQSQRQREAIREATRHAREAHRAAAALDEEGREAAAAAEDEGVEDAVVAESHEEGDSSSVAWFLVQFLVLFGLGALGFLAFPNRMRHLENELRAAPVASIFVGMLGLLAAFPLTILLFITLVGIPVAFVLWAALVAFWLFGLTVIARIIGSKLPGVRTSRSEALLLASGLLVLLLAFSIPGLNWVLVPLGAFVGVGAGLLAILRGRNRGLPEPMESGISSPV